MSEIDLDSPKIDSAASEDRRSSAVFSWESTHGDPGTPEEDDRVPKHLFLSPTVSVSAQSSSSHSHEARRRRRRRNIEETSFISEVDNKTKVSLIYKKNEVHSSTSRSRGSSASTSSESEALFSKSKKSAGKKSDALIRSVSMLKTNNKIHDSKTNNENQRPKEVSSDREKVDDRSQSKLLLEVPKSGFDRRSSAGGSSIDIGSETSYKDRIRDRFQLVKERTIESLSRPSSRLKSGFQRMGRMVIEEALKKEEFELSVAMKRHEEIKLRWQKACKASLEGTQSENVEVTFFSDDDDEEDDGEGEKVPLGHISEAVDKTTVPSKEKSSTEEVSESKMLTSELLGIKEDWDLVEFVHPQMKNLKNEKLWRENLFFPSSKPVSLESKLEPGLTPRFLEKEGMFIGEKIKVLNRLKNKCEQRILQVPEGRKWFARDGDLISSASPLKAVNTRPCYNDDTGSNSSTALYWKPATLGDLSHRYMDLSGNLNYVLDIDISSIEFTHHPLFSKEHVLAQTLKELYIKYKKRREMDALNRLNGRLKALRKTRDNLKNVILQGGDNEHLKKELDEYENDIREVRKMRYVEGRMDKQLKNKILSTWKDLSKLRETQGYQSTSIKLIVRKKSSELSEKEVKAQWDAELKQEINEILDEAKNQYKKDLNEYKEKYKVWMKRRKEKKMIEKQTEDSIEKLSDTESVNRSDSNEEKEEDESDDEEKDDNDDDDDDDDDDDVDNENEELVEVEEEKENRKKKTKKEPKPPKPVVANEIKMKIAEKFKASFQAPDEPDLEFFMTKDAAADLISNNNKEEMRRTAVKKNLVFMKLHYNGKEVCRSKSRPLSQKFTVKLSQRFAVRILEWPESLMLEIHEDTGTLTKNNLLVTGIYVPFPDSFTTVQNSEVVKYEFSSDIPVSYHHAAVGSGNEIIPCPDGSDFNNQPVCRYTSGIVACRIGWVDDGGKILSPTEKYWNNIRDEPADNLLDTLLSGGSFDVTKLKEWAEKSKLDPNDPYNSAFFHFLENAGDSATTNPTHFRLNPLLAEFDFCDEKVIEDNPRLKLLTLRNSGEPEFTEFKMIPLNEKQIHKEIFKEYEKRVAMQFSLAKVNSTDPINGHRVWGKKYLEQVQQMLLKQCLMSRQSRRYHDIIAEESVPDVGTLGLTFVKWLRPKRPLRPVRKERKKITPQNFSGQEIKIVVNVVRAFEVPVRKDIDSKSANGSIDGFSLVNVRPFVEISFQGATARTTAAEGANPTWNQDLQISLNNKNGHFSTGNFQTIKDTLYLHLFDEMVIDLIEDESARETNIHQRLEKHWLASMEIPFSTLYFNSRIEGTFKLYSPPILLGYEREAHRLHFSGSTGQEPLLPQRDATYITLFVTVQPALNPPKSIKEKMECSETVNLEKHLEGWLAEVTEMFPHRKVKALVLDMTGKSVCVTRFVRPLPVPPIADDEENVTPELIARFVAMIPLVTESTISPGFFDIWLNCDQILRLLSGDAEDHAILLCCYFLKIGIEAYVLLGSGIPHGFTAYVLVREKISKTLIKHYVWDPTNGQKYNVDDSFCPLQKVYCIISDQNIWANIQTEEMPRRTRFDLTKRGDWFPAFGKGFSAPGGSVQPQSIDYRKTSRHAVDFLQDKIEKKLRDSLMKWRRRQRTPWNRYCAATLRKLLPSLERSTWNLGDHTPDHVLELQHILASHKMCGFPINMAYTRIDAVTEAVKATGVHCNENEGVEFALAVYIHPYPNNVLSVWVYVASLIRRR